MKHAKKLLQNNRKWSTKLTKIMISTKISKKIAESNVMSLGSRGPNEKDENDEDHNVDKNYKNCREA